MTLGGIKIGVALALAENQAIEKSAMNFSGFALKSRNEATGISVYTFTFIKDGVPTNYDVEFKDGKTPPVFTDVKFIGDDIVFSLSNNSTITLPNVKKELKGDAGDVSVITGISGGTF